MNTEFLVGFIETAHRRSIAKASEALHITHTALSKQLRSLEKHFDVQLFVRSSQGVELTDAGRIVYESSKSLLDQLSLLDDKLKPFRIWSRVKIATVPDIATTYLVSALPKLHDQGHEVEIIYRHSTKDVYKLLIEGEVDLIVAERFSMHPSVWSEELRKEAFYVVMPKDHPLSGQQDISLKELSGQPLVLYNEGCTIRATLTQMFASLNRPMQIKTEVGFSEVILGYVGNGSGVTVLPEALVSQMYSDRLVHRPLNHPDAHRSIHVASMNQSKGRRIKGLIS
ncbi:DNA-binding transcriptional LysR family regulator [Paenibacillus phyllosphaerae]|uniref:DNA-binding transcriptional LysR family regulator n=1 Tax=Paenibacillus phyllosphaerae TaxID=274593 RepID=A0A7W5B6B7_9BACL|nr:LysR family transcriptional regulator [Paenibacillus phyllosphaerae]MBB3114781.1 DNA-binding transcriptional LysR family regulator [Paenibacillus phyllosphaerae]